MAKVLGSIRTNRLEIKVDEKHQLYGSNLPEMPYCLNLFSLDRLNVAELTAVPGVVQTKRLVVNKWETLCQFNLTV